jgi:nicotinamide-nucleotide amidase
MATGALKELKADYCIATSGIMGPDGGTPEKPVGTVWIAAGDNSSVFTQKFHFRFDRSRNIEMTAVQALNLLRRYLLDHA